MTKDWMSCEVHPCLHFVPVWSKAMQLGSCLEADAYERDLRELRQSIAGDMPRVVANQKEKFQNDEIFQKLSREGEIKYVGYRDRPLEERQLRFQTECREGNSTIAFTASGINVDLIFPKQGESQTVPSENVDFYREKDKVFLRSHLIMNGVCVLFVGWLNIIKLDGVGYLTFDEERSQIEDERMRETLRKANIKLEEFQKMQQGSGEIETLEVQNTHM